MCFGHGGFKVYQEITELLHLAEGDLIRCSRFDSFDEIKNCEIYTDVMVIPQTPE